MSDLKEIKRWGKKAQPHIYALEPRMLFDGEPINTIPEPQSINHDMPSLIVGVSVHDPDDNLLSTQLSVLHGTVTVDISAGASIFSGSNGTNTLTLTGSEAEINTALATLRYTGNSKYIGRDTLTLLSTDSLENRDEDTVEINVINSAPEVDLASANLETVTNEDESVEDYLPQATDVENDAIVYAITKQPTYGTVLLINDGTTRFRYTPNLVGDGKPNNFYGPDTFEFTVSDGVNSNTYTFKIDILPVNDAPQQTGPLATLNNYYEDDPIEINASDLLVGFTDVDLLDTLSVTDVTVSYGFTWELKDGVYTITAPTDFNGNFDFSYYVSDGIEKIAVNRSINVLAVNDTPVRTIGMYEPISLLEGSANNTAVSLGLDGFRYEGGSGDDEKDQILTYQIVTIPDFLKLYKKDGITEVKLEPITLEELRELTYKTVENKNGSGLIEWTIQDNDNANPKTLRESLSVTVTPINHPPSASDVTVSTLEDNAIISGTLPSYTDVNNDAVTYAKASDPSNGSVSINSNGTYTYTPNANFNGTDSFEYSINDGNGGTNSYTVTVNVAAVNDSPTASTANIETNEDIAFSGVLPFATDIEGDAVTYSMATDAIEGSVYINSDGSFTYTPNANFNGTDSFEYRITDGNGGSSTYRINVDITSVNDAPIGGDKTLTINEDNPYTLIGSDFGFTDTDGDMFSGVKITSLPLNGTLTLNEVVVEVDDFISIGNINANKLVFTPFPNEQGIAYASFTFKVADHSGAINNLDIISRTITFDVNAVNDAPSSDNASASTLEDTRYTIKTSDFTIVDEEGHHLEAVKITSLPTNGTLTLNGNLVILDTVISIGDIALGKLVFEPTSNENGVAYANFTFQLQDDGDKDRGGINLSPEKTFTIDVTAVNDAPALTGDKATLEDGTEGASYTITRAQLLGGYTDVDLDMLSIVDLDAGAGFTIDDKGDGTYTINTPLNYKGPVNLTYQVSDGTIATDATQRFILRAVTDVAISTDKSLLATLSRTNTLNDGFELNRRADASTKYAYQADEDSVILNKFNMRQAGFSNVKLTDIDELFFVGTSRGLAREPSGEANKDVSLQDSVAVIKGKIFRNAETPPGPITDSQGRIMYKLPETIFKGAQGAIKLAATSKDGSPLPDWIKFDSKTGKLTAEVPKDVKSPIEIKIEAEDTRGHKAEATLKILPRPNNMSFSGKHSLSSQFKSAFDLIA